MQCKTFFLSSVSCTLLLVLAIFTTRQLPAKINLPDKVTIKLGNVEVEGSLGDVESLKQAPRELSESLPPTGFVYNVDPNNPNVFNIVAWTKDGDSTLLMQNAQDALTEAVSKNSPYPADGFMYTGRTVNSFGKGQARNSKPVQTKEVGSLNMASLGQVGPVNPFSIQPSTEISGKTGWGMSGWFWFWVMVLIFSVTAWLKEKMEQNKRASFKKRPFSL